jgi:hypothetical protein
MMFDLIAVPTGDAIERRHGLKVSKISSDFRVGKWFDKGALKNAPNFFSIMPGSLAFRRRSNYYALHIYGSNCLISGKTQLK